MTRSGLAAMLLAALSLGALLWARHLARRALPVLDGERQAPGLARKVEIVRDRWGVPPVFAEEDDDAYFALGYLHAQDRLFQLDLHRHAAQGRLAELVGERGVEIDRLFRTIDFHGPALRALERARPEVRAALEADARGVNAGVARLEGRLPLEFALLRHDFEPVQPRDFAGLVGYMAWGLGERRLAPDDRGPLDPPRSHRDRP